MKPLKLIFALLGILAFLPPIRAQAAAYAVYQGSTQRPLQFQMISASDHITGVTGLTPTVTLSKNGASFGSPAGAVSEIGNGWYAVAANATDDATLGVLTLHATAAGCDPTDREYDVVAYNIQSGTNLGLSALPTATPAASGGLLTVGTGSGQVSPSSGNVTIAGYASGQSPATLVLDTATSGHATSGTIGAAIGGALQATAYTVPPSTGQIAAAILANPSNLLATDSNGSPVLSAAVQNALRDVVWAEVIDGGVSAKSWVADIGAVSFGSVTNSFNSGTHTLNSTFKRQDGSTTGATVSTIYSNSTTSVPVTSRSGTASP